MTWVDFWLGTEESELLPLVSANAFCFHKEYTFVIFLKFWQSSKSKNAHYLYQQLFQIYLLSQYYQLQCGLLGIIKAF